jgi:hypothetical protein
MKNSNHIALLSRRVGEKQTTGELLFCEDDDLIFQCKTLEPPNLGNKKNISSIPIGDYWVQRTTSPRYGICFQIENVINREHILIHWGNFKTDTKGCVLVGSCFYDINQDGLKDVANSKSTFNEMMQVLPDRFLLLIR